MSTRRSTSVVASAAVTTTTPPSHPWFLNDDLMSAADFDKIKTLAPRHVIVAKMNRLGAPGTSGNILTVRNKLRIFLEKSFVPGNTTVTPPPPPTSVGSKRPRRGTPTTSQRAKETRFSRNGGSSELDNSTTQGAGTSPGVTTLSSELLMEALQSMVSRLALPLPPWSKNVTENPVVYALAKGLSWLDFEKLRPGMFFLLATKLINHRQVAVVEPFETLYHDGYLVMELLHKNRTTLGTGQQFCSVAIKVWEQVEGHPSLASPVVPNLFLGASKEFQFDSALPTVLVAREILDAQFNLEFKNIAVVSDREEEHLNLLQQSDTAQTALPRQSKSQSSTDDYPLLVEKTAGVDKFGMRTLYSEFDGKSLKYFSKITDIATRYKETRVAFRMTHIDVFLLLNQGKGELDFSINDAFCLLISSGNSWSGPLLHGEKISDGNFNGLPNTKRYNVLKRLPQLVNVKIYRLLLTEGWAVTHQSNGAMTYVGSVSLSTFASNPNEFSQRTMKKDSFGDKVFLVEVMKNLENYLVFVFGMIYDGVCKEIMESLQFGAWSLSNWDLAYTRYSMEKVLFKTFLEVKSVSRANYLKQYPECDICSPIDIAKFLRKRLSDLSPTVEEGTSFQQTFLDPLQKAALFGYPDYTNPRPSITSVATLSNALGDSGAEGQKSIWCVYDVYRQAGLVNSKTGAAFSCTKGASCPFIHGNFLHLPRKEQQSYIDRWTSTNKRGFQRTPVQLGKDLLRSLDKFRQSSTSSEKVNSK